MLDVDLDCERAAGARHKVIEAHDLDVITLSFRGGLDDLGEADIALRSGYQPKSPGLGAECHRMDFQIGVEQAVDQEIGAKMNAITAIGLEQDGARHQPVLHEDAGVEAKIGADIDEDIGFEAAAAYEIFQLAMLGDFGGNFEAADIGGAHQKLGAEIAADEITAAMDEFIIWAVEAAPDFVASA